LDIETCENCGESIGHLEPAYVHEGHIVCKKCYDKLKNNIQETTSTVPADITQNAPKIPIYDYPLILPQGSLAQNENMVFETRPNKFLSLFPPIIVIVVAIIGFLWFWCFLGLSLWEPHIILFFLVSGLWILYFYLDWRYTIYAITTQKVIKHSGIIRRDIFEADLGKIQDLRISIGILQRLLNCGTIVITTAGTAGVECKWENIYAPQKVRNMLKKFSTKSNILR